MAIASFMLMSFFSASLSASLYTGSDTFISLLTSAYTTPLPISLPIVNFKWIGVFGIVAMQAKRAIQDAVLSTASENVESHELVAAVEDCALSDTEAACLSYDNLLNWAEYRSVAL